MELKDLREYAKSHNARIFFSVGQDRCMINPQGDLKVAVTGYVDDPTTIEKDALTGQIAEIVDAALASANARKNHPFDRQKVFEEAERFEFHYEGSCRMVNATREGTAALLLE